jgi:NADH-quinone oxidoreductase subunit G
VVLPIAAFSETGGSYVNGEGRLQSFTGAVTPPGEARPAWKVLRVLGNMLGLAGFDYIGVDDVRSELGLASKLDNLAIGAAEITVNGPPAAPTRSEIDLERIYEVPLYVTDMAVRRAPALQACADNPQPAVRINPEQATRLDLAEGVRVNAHMGKSIVSLNLEFDERIPMGCILIPGGYESTAVLGGPGIARVVRA